MKKNILSIDLDSMYDCHTYAQYMNYDIDAEDAWKFIYYLEGTKKYGINTKIDFRALSKVIEILDNKCGNALIEIIDEHDEIVGIMEKHNSEESNMFNIDYHHDITYGNDDTELNLENWVRHSKARRLIDNYYWLCRPLSSIEVDSPFQYNRDCLEDVKVDLLPEFDLVVICISHQFTPMNTYKSLLNTLLSYINGGTKWVGEEELEELQDQLKEQ